MFSLKGPIKSKLVLVPIDGLVQDCSISIANALEILQSCTKLSWYWTGNQPSSDPMIIIFMHHLACMC